MSTRYPIRWWVCPESGPSLWWASGLRRWVKSGEHQGHSHANMVVCRTKAQAFRRARAALAAGAEVVSLTQTFRRRGRDLCREWTLGKDPQTVKAWLAQTEATRRAFVRALLDVDEDGNPNAARLSERKQETP